MKRYGVAADRSLYVATHDNLLRDQGTRDARPLADDDVLGMDVALHLALDLHLAPRLKVAGNGETRTDHRGCVVPVPTGSPPGCPAGSRSGRHRSPPCRRTRPPASCPAFFAKASIAWRWRLPLSLSAPMLVAELVRK